MITDIVQLPTTDNSIGLTEDSNRDTKNVKSENHQQPAGNPRTKTTIDYDIKLTIIKNSDNYIIEFYINNITTHINHGR